MSQHPAAELVQLRYRGSWSYDWFQHEQPVTFDTCSPASVGGPASNTSTGICTNADACVPGSQQYNRVSVLIRQLAWSLQRYRMPMQQVLPGSRHRSLVRAVMPELRSGLKTASDDFATGLRLAQVEKMHTVCLNADCITLEQATQAHAAPGWPQWSSAAARPRIFSEYLPRSPTNWKSTM